MFSFYHPSERPDTALSTTPSATSTSSPARPRPASLAADLLSHLDTVSSQLSTKLTLCSEAASSHSTSTTLASDLATGVKPALTRLKHCIAAASSGNVWKELDTVFSQKAPALKLINAAHKLGAGLLQLPDRFYSLLGERADPYMKVLQYTFLSLSMLATLLEALLTREPIQACLLREGLVRVWLLPLFAAHEKLRAVFSDIERWKGASAGRANPLVTRLAKALYTIGTAAEPALSQAVDRLIQILKRAFRAQDFELYCYTIGLIPAMLQGEAGRTALTRDFRILKLLSNHFARLCTDAEGAGGDPGDAEEESKSPVRVRPNAGSSKEWLYMASPMLIALRSLVRANSAQRKKLLQYESIVQSVVRLSLETFEDDRRGRLKNVHYSCDILLGELGASMGGPLIKDELVPSVSPPQEQGAEVNKQVYSVWKKQLLARMAQSSAIAQYFAQIEQNPFDDQLTANALDALAQLFAAHRESGKVLTTLLDGLDPLLAALGNTAPRVREAGLRALAALAAADPQAGDVLLRRKGLSTIASALSRSPSLSLRKSALSLLNNLLAERGQPAQTALRAASIFPDLLLEIIQSFPAHNSNLQVLRAALTNITLSLADNAGNQELFKARGGIQTLSRQLKELVAKLSTPERFSTDQVASYEEAFATLAIATNNAVYASPPNQEVLRELGVLQTAFQFLKFLITAPSPKRHWDSDILSGLRTDERAPTEGPPSEVGGRKPKSELVVHTVYLLVNAIDTNPVSQEKLGALDGLKDVVLELLQGDELKLCGRGCLLLHHLVWNCPRNRQLFGTKQFVAEVIRIAGTPATHEDPQQVYEANLYALLAMANMTQEALHTQSLFGAHGAVPVLLSLLADQDFLAKKTVCLCLANIARNHPENAKAAVGAIPQLAELINDEQDDELSNKAFAVIEALGVVAGYELLAEIQKLGAEIPLLSDLAPSAAVCLLNISADAQLFKFLSQAGNKQAKSLQKALKHSAQASRAIYKLEKYLPLLNGLVYMQEGVKVALQSESAGIVKLLARALPYSQQEEVLYILNNLAASGGAVPELVAETGHCASLAVHERLLGGKKIRLFEVAAGDGGVVALELEFEPVEDEGEDGEGEAVLMKCFRVLNNKRAGEFAEASVFLPDDILASLREQRRLSYELLGKVAAGCGKAGLEALCAGGAAKIEVAKSLAVDIQRFGSEERFDKLTRAAGELMLAMGEFWVEWRGGLGQAGTQGWKDCLKLMAGWPASAQTAVLKARAGQLLERLS